MGSGQLVNTLDPVGGIGRWGLQIIRGQGINTLIIYRCVSVLQLRTTNSPHRFCPGTLLEPRPQENAEEKDDRQGVKRSSVRRFGGYDGPSANLLWLDSASWPRNVHRGWELATLSGDTSNLDLVQVRSVGHLGRSHSPPTQ